MPGFDDALIKISFIVTSTGMVNPSTDAGAAHSLTDKTHNMTIIKLIILLIINTSVFGIVVIFTMPFCFVL